MKVHVVKIGNDYPRVFADKYDAVRCILAFIKRTDLINETRKQVLRRHLETLGLRKNADALGKVQYPTDLFSIMEVEVE